MAAITPVPLFMKDCLVKFGATDSYEAAVSSVTLTPSVNTVTAKALSPAAIYQNVDKATWTCDMTFLQDWASANSLGKYLFDNEGTSVQLTFEPITGGATITVNVVCTPGAIGGNVGAYAEATVSLPCSGKPTIGA